MIVGFQNNNTNFSGKTKVFALTDSHLQTRDKCVLLSKVLRKSADAGNILLLDCGDMFKGIYPPHAEVDAYLTAKKLRPNHEIVVNIGNNDPGYDKNGYEFFKSSVKTLSDNGIHVISANIWDKFTGERIEGIKPYAVVKRGQDRIMVLGLCINNLTTSTHGVKSEDPRKTLASLKQSIVDEKPDGIIVLNHDWYSDSQKIVKFARKHGIKVDLVIGGHEHAKFEPDPRNRLYQPEAFNRSMYQFDLHLQNGKSSLRNIRLHQNYHTCTPPSLESAPDVTTRPKKGNRNERVRVHEINSTYIHPMLGRQITEIEKNENLLDVVAPSYINFTKSYSDPCSLGTFLADAMKTEGGTDIAFFSTGTLMAPLPSARSGKITNFDLKKTMIAQYPLQKITATPEVLKEVFQNALQNRMYKDRGNAKFLQCSQNIKLVGKRNPDDKTYKLTQIFINDEPLFDETTQKALDPTRQITCTIDPFIGGGGQGFGMLKPIPKEPVTKDGADVRIDEVLKNALKKLAENPPKVNTYESFDLTDL